MSMSRARLFGPRSLGRNEQTWLRREGVAPTEERSPSLGFTTPSLHHSQEVSVMSLHHGLCRPSLPTGRPGGRLVRALALAVAAHAALLIAACPAAAQVSDPAYGAGPGVSAGQPITSTGQTTTTGEPGVAAVSPGQPGVAAITPGRGTEAAPVAARALPNTGSGPADSAVDWTGAAAAGSMMLLVSGTAVSRWRRSLFGRRGA